MAVGPSGGGAARHAQSPAPVALDRCRRLHCRQLALYFSGFERRPSAVSAIDPAFGLLWLIGMALAIGAAVSAKYHRLAGLIMLGGVGLVVCMTFIWLSAPDLAITQLLVEIVTHRPDLARAALAAEAQPRHWRGYNPAEPFPTLPGSGARDPLRGWHVGGGLYRDDDACTRRDCQLLPAECLYRRRWRNVVNVILVDFRAFDTLGEIAVLGIVGLTVYGLLRRFRPAEDSMELPEQQVTQNRFDADQPERSPET